MGRREFAKGRYLSEQGKYILEAELSIESLVFPVALQADTGFNGGIFLPKSYSERLEQNNIYGYIAPLRLADGSRILAKTYLGAIKKISEYQFNPAILISVFCYGDSTSLVGLEVLNQWISEFHGPENNLTLFFVS